MKNPRRYSDIARQDRRFLKMNKVEPFDTGKPVADLDAALACASELQMVRALAEEQARRASVRLKIERSAWQVVCTIMGLVIVVLVCTGRWS